MAMTLKLRARTAMLPFALLAMGGLAACSGKKTEVAEEASITRKPPADYFNIDDITGSLRTAPDEFSVVTKKPLEMPPSLDALPPPEPGKISSRDADPVAEARQALLRDTGAVPASISTTPSAAERVVLGSVGGADPNIRATVAAEQAQYDSQQQKYILDRYFPILPRLRGETQVGALDPVAERERLVREGILAPALPGAPLSQPAGTAAITTPSPAPAQVTTETYLPAPSYQAAPTIYEPAPVTAAPAPQPASNVPTFGGPIQTVPQNVESDTGLIYIQ